jgi:hypothetical protein
MIFGSQAIERGIKMRQSWEEARAQCQAALGELVEGRPEAFKALWSHADDVTIMGAFGGFERGWDNVASGWIGRAQGSAAASAVSRTFSLWSAKTWLARWISNTWSAPVMGARITVCCAAPRSTGLRTRAGRSSSDMPTSCRRKMR